MQYRPEIDGLRALAVLPVIMFHAGLEVFSGGFVGVDVFFVISGYLITSIILSDMRMGTFSLLHFYERRARRILPALFLVIVVTIPLAWLWLLPREFMDFSQSMMAVSVFASNIFFWRTTGYFDGDAELKPLLHTWSLAVEEQFYLIFPVALLLLALRTRRPILIITLTIAAVVSLAASQWGATLKPRATFFLLPTRAWELLLGSLVAIYLLDSRQTVSYNANQILSVSGLAMVAASIFLFDRSTPFPSVYALVPTIGAALIIIFATPQTLVSTILSQKPIVSLGLISYSAYLWHQPLFAFARHVTPTPELSNLTIGSIIAATIALSFLTWLFIERPARSSKRVSTGAVLGCASGATLLMFTAGIVSVYYKGFERHFIDSRLSADERARYQLIRKHTGGDLYREMEDNADCHFWGRSVDELSRTRFDRCAGTYRKAIVVLGDSHAMNIFNIVSKADIHPFVVGISQGGCRPHNNHAFCHYDAFDKFVANHGYAIDLILFHQSGSYFLRDEKGRVDSANAFSKDAPTSIDQRNIDSVKEYLNKLTQYADTIWLGPFVEARIDFRKLNSVKKELAISDDIHRHFSELDRHLKRSATNSNNVFAYVSINELIGLDKQLLQMEDCVTFRDEDHFSKCGETIVAKRIKQSFDGNTFSPVRSALGN